MTHEITDLDRIRAAIDIRGKGYQSNAIEAYLWDENIDQCDWSSVQQIIDHLTSATCAHGSFSGMIYTRDILDRLRDPDWVDAIDNALEAFEDAIGEQPTFDTLDLSTLVTFAVDWYACEIASRLRSLGQVSLVAEYADTLDTRPDVIAFDDVSDAEDFIHDRCAEYATQNARRYANGEIVEESYEELFGEMAALYQITVETLT